MNESDEPGEYGLVMPFVVTTSHDGPYADDAFVAGYQAGQIDLLLPITAQFGSTVERYVPPALVPQLDLIAMRHGYTLTTEPWDEHPDDYTRCTFTVTGPRADDD